MQQWELETELIFIIRLLHTGLCYDGCLFDNEFQIIISMRIMVRIAEPLIKGHEQAGRYFQQPIHVFL